MATEKETSNVMAQTSVDWVGGWGVFIIKTKQKANQYLNTCFFAEWTASKTSLESNDSDRA